jgi:cell division protein FtsL
MKDETSIALLKKDIQEVKKDISELKSSIDKSFLELKKNIDEVKSCYVRNERFNPIEKGFYALIGTVALTVLGALLATVVRAGL